MVFKFLANRKSHRNKISKNLESIVHLDPLTPSGDIEGWAYQANSTSLKGTKLAILTSSKPNKIFCKIDILRPDVGEIKNTDGINGFLIKSPSKNDIGLLLDGDLGAEIEGKPAKIIYTDHALLTAQILQKLGNSLDIKELLLEFHKAKSTALYWHFLVTSELKKGKGSLDDLLELANSDNASLVSSHRTRSEEIKLLLQYESYINASLIYEKAVEEASSRHEVEAFRHFKATYLALNYIKPSNFDSNPLETNQVKTHEDQIFDIPNTLEDCLSLVIDLPYLERSLDASWKDKKKAALAYIKASAEGQKLSPNATFDPGTYSNRYKCHRDTAILDLLSDTSLERRPFEEFDTLFVYEYYCKPISYRNHPYVYFIENPSILINPSQYFKSGSKNSGNSEPEYWNLSRANSHFANIFTSIKPNIKEDIRKAIHILVPAFDPKTISAGFFGVFSTAKLLAELQDEYDVKLLFTDVFEFYPSLFKYTLSKTTGMENLLDTVSYHFLQPGNLPHAVFHRDDKFVATVWYTAKIAKNLIKSLSSNSMFLYLIQDYEAGFYPRNSHYALASSTYDKGYWALVSSETLYRQLLQENLIDQDRSIHFNNACAARKTTYSAFNSAHANKTAKRLLFYARPEVDRNMFELTILSLMMAYKDNIIDKSWDVYSIGLGSDMIIELNNFIDSHAFVNTVPRMTLHEYEEFILSTDICLTLMASPHPSLLPFDFAGIGSLVVTNSFQSKNQDYFSDISDLIICKKPDPHELVEGIRVAVEKSNDLDWRFKCSDIKYPRSWSQTWNSSVIATLKRWVNH